MGAEAWAIGGVAVYAATLLAAAAVAAVALLCMLCPRSYCQNPDQWFDGLIEANLLQADGGSARDDDDDDDDDEL